MTGFMKNEYFLNILENVISSKGGPLVIENEDNENVLYDLEAMEVLYNHEKNIFIWDAQSRYSFSIGGWILHLKRLKEEIQL